MLSLIVRRFSITDPILLLTNPRVVTVTLPAFTIVAVPFRSISTSNVVEMPFEGRLGPKGWPRYNKIVFPPQKLDEERRPAVGYIKYGSS